MKPLRLVSAPTRSRRLNEILGMIVLVAAGLFLLALASYTPTDPSFNSVGGYITGRPAHNWIGLFGAWTSDAILQTLGIAAFLLPVLLVRLGVCWLKSRPAGSAIARWLGLGMWVVFAPAAVALLPGHLLWRNSLPIEGLGGRMVSDFTIQLLNLPGACIVLALAVLLSLYLATTFSFSTAREWMTMHFAFAASIRERWNQRQARRRGEMPDVDLVDATGEVYGAKREKLAAEARKERERAEKAATRSSNTLLSTLFGWWPRRKDATISITPSQPEAAPTSVWEAMPRMNVDAPPVTPLSTATAAAAPYAEALAAAAAPLPLQPDELDLAPVQGRFVEEEPFSFLSQPVARPVQEPKRAVLKPQLVEAVTAEAGPISFGRRADTDVKAVAITAKSVRGYKLPSSSLLYRSEEQAIVREDALREEARVLVEKCGEFGVDGQVTQINPGPVVTTFEFRPDAGVKYSRVTGLADDLCLAMAAESILIERMAGKSTVGIQVPNSDRETIWLRDVVECESFAQSKSKLAIALGKDINGRIVTADLASMPHVLIAGSTGSGKSVAINAMIMSVLFKSTPEQVRMILVDPKRVELGMYEGIPHLFTPIITEAKLAANALRNAVREMERRLKLLAANHVRNIDQFNKLFDNGSEYLFEDVNQEPLPYIIIIIDELADLMMLDRSNVEESITRLAQMARAVGIHLILATQRPSVDVITGLIKANVPTRMSFRLATKVDSRTIIDSNGAESLLGRGDMLYLPPGTSRLQRVHAPFVTEKEISAVTAFWRAQGEAEYVEGFLEGPKDEKDGSGVEGSHSDENENDPMFDDAVRLVFEFGKASTSLLQRRLRIGYGRAAHLIDLMERDGLVGPADGSKPREILKSPSFYSEIDAALR
ncbi:DNA translocase FtsK [Granulicella tundricola]|uniref:Cell division protein FtsK/SpoIIIE n=1 Tax=Granulicella tundricola (strain ATCC BAA-1859 / DSM 23138 / MP5ACTX9) TaxID=1198114 RepID=E8WZQ9_GRATM|nr:DNA translocase FtsK [Granulicella tundricola]ADW70033.1 cell division protein FtsK/SpoIIIE [Granulicella tundricola MP5ACTX9]